MARVEHFDAVIIGSGFGGSVMAYRLAQAGMRICLLERGKRYPPGSFPRSPREMGENFWDPDKGRLGLFQVWRFKHMDGVVSAGLGGGSLIYANVLLRKDEDWFVRRRSDGGYDNWPVTRSELNPHYDNVESMLTPQPYPFDVSPYDATPKTIAFRDAANSLIEHPRNWPGTTWELPNLAITFGGQSGPPVPGEPIRDARGRTTDNLHGRTRTTCRLCGECDIGCNDGSKNTLDYNYLTEAARLGAELRDRCEVRTLAPTPDGEFSIGYVDRRGEGTEGSVEDEKHGMVKVTANRLILAAGTFGSTFLLLKNRHNFPDLSNRLGHHFSGNGDLLGLVHHAQRSEGERRTRRVLAASYGPVITSALRVPDTRDRGDGPGFYVEDGGYPGFVDWMVEAGDLPATLGRVLRLAEQHFREWLHHGREADLDSELSGLLGDGGLSASLLPLLGMGLDTPSGTMSVDNRGCLCLDWEKGASSEYFTRVGNAMRAIASALNAKVELDPLLSLRDKLITVHPLGGCSMGNSVDDGVVDSNGEVFHYPGFVIADGSVMPGPVGPNPSLTIAALSDRFAEHQIRDFTHWRDLQVQVQSSADD
jgi:cholesterol oxidase